MNSSGGVDGELRAAQRKNQERLNFLTSRYALSKDTEWTTSDRLQVPRAEQESDLSFNVCRISAFAVMMGTCVRNIHAIGCCRFCYMYFRPLTFVPSKFHSVCVF